MEDSIQVPAGLEACLTGVQFQVDQEGGRKEWLQYSAIKRFTNVFIIDASNNKVSPASLSRLMTNLKGCRFSLGIRNVDLQKECQYAALSARECGD
jgi:hypothetical protein